MTKSSTPSRDISSSGNLHLMLEFVKRGVAFRQDAQRILATHEWSKSRTITIEQSYRQLATLTLKQDGLLRQSLKCTEFSLYRAAHVLAWAALIDYLEQKLSKDQFKQLNKLRPKWGINSIDDLRDTRSDYQIVDAVRGLELCTKTEEKALKGLLSLRNECAHPTDYEPELNETLGYVSQILQRLERLQKRWSG
jgi:hypothetical protein